MTPNPLALEGLMTVGALNEGVCHCNVAAVGVDKADVGGRRLSIID